MNTLITGFTLMGVLSILSLIVLSSKPARYAIMIIFSATMLTMSAFFLGLFVEALIEMLK